MKKVLAHIVAFIVWFVSGGLILIHPISSIINDFNSGGLESISRIDTGYVGFMFMCFSALAVAFHALVESIFDE